MAGPRDKQGQADTGGAAEPPVFRIRALSMVYVSGALAVRALRDVDLDIAQAQFIVLLGASGSGKSTFLNILGGLDNASSGQVLFGDQDLSGRRGGADRIPSAPRGRRVPVLQPHSQPHRL